MDDLISRQAAIEAICVDGTMFERQGQYSMTMAERKQRDTDILDALPSMTDGKWIPVSDRLPEKDGEYLVCPSDDVLEDYSDFSDVMIMPYDEGCGAFGWWTDRFDNVSLGYIDSDFNKFDVIAWKLLPEPYRESEE